MDTLYDGSKRLLFLPHHIFASSSISSASLLDKAAEAGEDLLIEGGEVIVEVIEAIEAAEGSSLRDLKECSRLTHTDLEGDFFQGR